MNLPSKETGVKATGDAKQFSPDSANRVVWQSDQHQEASFEYQFLKRELCFLARALSETRQLENQRARDHSAIEVAGSLKESAGLQPRKLAPRFGVRPLPPLKTLRFKSAPESRGANSPGNRPPARSNHQEKLSD